MSVEKKKEGEIDHSDPPVCQFNHAAAVAWIDNRYAKYEALAKIGRKVPGGLMLNLPLNRADPLLQRARLNNQPFHKLKEALPQAELERAFGKPKPTDLSKAKEAFFFTDMPQERYQELLKNLNLHLSLRSAKPLFIIESGSRAWGMASKDSDYDIRVVYASTRDKYLQLTDPKPDLQLSVDEHFVHAKGEKVVYDIVCYDVKKFLRLMVKSNPAAVEWCNSPILYYTRNNFAFDKRLKELVQKADTRAMFYHYTHLCNNNYHFSYSSVFLPTKKRYLYAMRGLVNALYLLQHQTGGPVLPPMDLAEAVNTVEMPQEVKDATLELIKEKKQGLEQAKANRIVILDNFIESFLDGNLVALPVKIKQDEFSLTRRCLADSLFLDTIKLLTNDPLEERVKKLENRLKDLENKAHIKTHQGIRE